MHQDREIRQESYLATKYEKTRQDVGLFLCFYFIQHLYPSYRKRRIHLHIYLSYFVLLY